MLRLSLRQMAGRRRLLIIVVLAALPVALALIIKRFASGDAEFSENFIDTILDGMIIGAVMPIVVMTLATAAFGNEIEDRTLNVLVLKPVRRVSIAFPKLAGSIIVASPVMVVSGVIVTAIALDSGGVRGVAASGIALLVGVIAYASVFTWAGLMSSRALGFGLVYVFLWEGLITSFLNGVRYLSIRGYTLGILHGLDETTYRTIGDRVIPFPAAIAGAAAVTALFFFLTVRRLKRMDVQ